MAGAGFKTFGVGDVLTASDVNTYLMQQAVMNFASSGARGSAIGTATEGMVSYLADTDAVEVYDGSAWVSVAPTPTAPAILQVVQATEEARLSISVPSNTTTAITAFTASITPSSASNKVLVVVSANLSDAGGLDTAFVLQRGGADLWKGDALSTSGRATSGAATQGEYFLASSSIVYLDSPASTSAQTYRLAIRHRDASTRTVYLNSARRNATATNYTNLVGASSITLMEVAG